MDGTCKTNEQYKKDELIFEFDIHDIKMIALE